ncbi:hemin uptake protein HemP [Paludibacterium paludis]|uniref:Hemin uptake protein HemP n=1 Tax=Paludibacterium paludis TaxID=1225769 RepID=A0A918UB00_9NEIS|nr:hemin uptake protein HemP [Paludibacterium paludis]GGY25657.1 hypothetical protein GCM10011289_31610 [Paludibacterium paludis]
MTPTANPRLPARSAEKPSAAPRTDSQALLGTSREIHISHNGEIYRLCLTRQNKLILVK